MVPGKLAGIAFVAICLIGLTAWGYARIGKLHCEILAEVDERRQSDPAWKESVFVPTFRLHQQYFPWSDKREEYRRLRVGAGILFIGLIGLLVKLVGS